MTRDGGKRERVEEDGGKKRRVEEEDGGKRERVEEEGRRSKRRKKKTLGENAQKRMEQLTRQARGFVENRESYTTPIWFENLQERLTSLKGKHEDLREALNRRKVLRVGPPENTVPDLELETWNDAMIASWRDEFSDSGDDTRSLLSVQIAGKMVSMQKGGRISVRFDSSFAGQKFESYDLELDSKSSSEKLCVSRHSIPYFLPLAEFERAKLGASITDFIDSISKLLHAYVSRREQMDQLKSMAGAKMEFEWSSLNFGLVVFMLKEPRCKVDVRLVYCNPTSELPTECTVSAWPHFSEMMERRESHRPEPKVYRLESAESALLAGHLHQCYEEIIQDLDKTLPREDPTIQD